ncbi:CopD family protein [Aromatoleum sp.]|uniref:CopD family protein n=1 Tax=Aromatoleum sp. TaxID=2307007 RepID=UPI002FC8E220
MPLLKLLHFAGLICWCGALLYLPALVAAAGDENSQYRVDRAWMARQLFIAFATPAALIAIGTGTALFLRDGIVAPWLVLKLVAVAGMTVCHIGCGGLILRIERHLELDQPPAGIWLSVFTGIVSAAFIGAALWLVLAKPGV